MMSNVCERKRFHVTDYNVVLEWSPKPRFRIYELGIIVMVDCNANGQVLPHGLAQALTAIIGMASQALARFNENIDHPLPLGSVIDQLVISKDPEARQPDVTIPTAARLLGESEQTVRRAIDHGHLPGRKTPGGKRFVPVRAIAERRIGNRKLRPIHDASGAILPAPRKPFRAAEAIRLSGLSRATFYRTVKKLISLGILAPTKLTPHQRGFFEDDIEKIRQSTRVVS